MTFSWHEHFKKIIQFLDEYKIFYNFTNTDILTQNILNRISDDWKTFYKNNGKKLSDDNLGPFQEFFQSVDTLKKMPNIESQEYTKISTDQNKLFLGLNDKKRHEIEELSKAIHNKCTVSGIKVIVDLGSGLVSIFIYITIL